MKLIRDSELKARTLKSVPVENAIVGYNTYEKETEIAVKKGIYNYTSRIFYFSLSVSYLYKFYLILDQSLSDNQLTKINPENKLKTFQKKTQIVDFGNYYKHLTLTDNEFIYYKRSGNPIEFVECNYGEIIPQKEKGEKIKSKTMGKLKPVNRFEYLTISKNVLLLSYLTFH